MNRSDTVKRIIMLTATLFFTDGFSKTALPSWSQFPEIGFWFYHTDDPKPPLKKQMPNCSNPKSWDIRCGFMPPQHFGLSGANAYAFEQHQYHSLLRDFVLNPNTLNSVLRWQKFNNWVIERATEAAYNSEFLIAQNPSLSNNLHNPTAQFARLILKKVTEQKRQHFFKFLSKSSALVYFIKSDCPYCKAQTPIIQTLEQHTGIPVWYATLNANPTQYAKHQIGPAMTKIPAQQLKVKQVPTLFLYLVPNPKTVGLWIRLSTGLVDQKTLEDRLVHFFHTSKRAITQGIKQTTVSNRRLGPFHTKTLGRF